MFEQTDPKTMVKWLILAAIVYLVLPYDLLPDFIGLPGRIDDVLIMAWLAWFYRNHVHQYVAKKSQPASGESKSVKTFDPYAVLGVTPSASRDAIQAAYRLRMKEYHPDKVAHLGEELQALAHDKSQQIQRAYRQLHR